MDEEEAGAFFMSPKLVKIFLLEEREKGTRARATDRLAFHPSRVLRCSAVEVSNSNYAQICICSYELLRSPS